MLANCFLPLIERLLSDAQPSADPDDVLAAPDLPERVNDLFVAATLRDIFLACTYWVNGADINGRIPP